MAVDLMAFFAKAAVGKAAAKWRVSPASAIFGGTKCSAMYDWPDW